MKSSPFPVPPQNRWSFLPKASDRWPVAALGLFASILAMRAVAVVPLSQLMIDDGFYYLRIAHNLAWGLGSTWDGLHATNGYHPLWLLCLVPLRRAVPDPDTALAAVFAVETGLLAIAVVLLYLACRRVAGRWISSLAALLWLGVTYRWFFSGMEYALHTVLILAVISVYSRWSSRRPSALGGLLAVAFLARIDTLLLAGVLAIAGLVSASLETNKSTWLLKLLAPLALVVTGYIALNLMFFGHPLPVSGVVKGDWSRYLLHHDALFVRHGFWVSKAANWLWPTRLALGAWSLTLAAGTVGIAVVAGVAARWFRGNGLDVALRPLAPFIVFSLLSFLTYATVYHGLWSTSAWYFAIQPILAALLLASLAERAAHGLAKPKAVASLVAIAMALAGARLFAGIGQAQPPEGHGIQPVLAALATLPEDAALASWNGGAMAYLSGREVIALDGLANSWDYARSHRHDLCAYWRATGVTHLVDAFRFIEGRPANSVYPGDPGYSSYADCADRLKVVWTAEPSTAVVRMAILELTE